MTDIVEMGSFGWRRLHQKGKDSSCLGRNYDSAPTGLKLESIRLHIISTKIEFF